MPSIFFTALLELVLCILVFKTNGTNRSIAKAFDSKSEGEK